MRKDLKIVICLSLLLALSSPATAEKEGEILYRWRNIVGARGYRIQIRDDDNRVVLDRKTIENNVRFSLPPGDYRHRIAVINKFYKRSRWSPWRPFIIRRALAPEIIDISPRYITLEEKADSRKRKETGGPGQQFEISGRNFLKESRVRLVAGNRVLPVRSLTFVDKNTLRIVVAPDRTMVGSYDVIVENPANKVARKSRLVAFLRPSFIVRPIPEKEKALAALSKNAGEERHQKEELKRQEAARKRLEEIKRQEEITRKQEELKRQEEIARKQEELKRQEEIARKQEELERQEEIARKQEELERQEEIARKQEELKRQEEKSREKSKEIAAVTGEEKRKSESPEERKTAALIEKEKPEKSRTKGTVEEKVTPTEGKEKGERTAEEERQRARELSRIYREKLKREGDAEFQKAREKAWRSYGIRENIQWATLLPGLPDLKQDRPGKFSIWAAIFAGYGALGYSEYEKANAAAGRRDNNPFLDLFTNTAYFGYLRSSPWIQDENTLLLFSAVAGRQSRALEDKYSLHKRNQAIIGGAALATYLFHLYSENGGLLEWQRLIPGLPAYARGDPVIGTFWVTLFLGLAGAGYTEYNTANTLAQGVKSDPINLLFSDPTLASDFINGTGGNLSAFERIILFSSLKNDYDQKMSRYGQARSNQATIGAVAAIAYIFHMLTAPPIENKKITKSIDAKLSPPLFIVELNPERGGRQRMEIGAVFQF